MSALTHSYIIRTRLLQFRLGRHTNLSLCWPDVIQFDGASRHKKRITFATCIDAEVVWKVTFSTKHDHKHEIHIIFIQTHSIMLVHTRMCAESAISSMGDQNSWSYMHCPVHEQSVDLVHFTQLDSCASWITFATTRNKTKWMVHPLRNALYNMTYAMSIFKIYILCILYVIWCFFALKMSKNDFCVPRDACHFDCRRQQKKVNGALCARYIVDDVW